MPQREQSPYFREPPTLNGFRLATAVHQALEGPFEVHHPNAIAHWRVTVVLSVVHTTQPYKPRRRHSQATG
jgi:hypothetical protein